MLNAITDFFLPPNHPLIKKNIHTHTRTTTTGQTIKPSFVKNIFKWLRWFYSAILFASRLADRTQKFKNEWMGDIFFRQSFREDTHSVSHSFLELLLDARNQVMCYGFESMVRHIPNSWRTHDLVKSDFQRYFLSGTFSPQIFCSNSSWQLRRDETKNSIFHASLKALITWFHSLSFVSRIA